MPIDLTVLVLAVVPFQASAEFFQFLRRDDNNDVVFEAVAVLGDIDVIVLLDGTSDRIGRVIMEMVGLPSTVGVTPYILERLSFSKTDRQQQDLRINAFLRAHLLIHTPQTMSTGQFLDKLLEEHQENILYGALIKDRPELILAITADSLTALHDFVMGTLHSEQSVIVDTTRTYLTIQDKQQKFRLQRPLLMESLRKRSINSEQTEEIEPDMDYVVAENREFVLKPRTYVDYLRARKQTFDVWVYEPAEEYFVAGKRQHFQPQVMRLARYVLGVKSPGSVNIGEAAKEVLGSDENVGTSLKNTYARLRGILGPKWKSSIRWKNNRLIFDPSFTYCWIARKGHGFEA